MDPNQDNQNGGDTGDNRQAIFTPQPEQSEVVPNASAPTQPSTILSHPYFSNHPTQTFNNDTGDIILNTGGQKPKQNKRPFIIGGIILAVFAVVCVVVLLIVQAISKPSKSDIVKSFEAYKSYIENGPDSSGSADDWFLFQLADAEFDTADKKEYAEKADELFVNFKKTLNASGITLDANLKKLIATEESLLSFATTLINIDTASQPLIDSYMADGMETAKSKIAQVVPQVSDSDFRNGFRDALIEYLTSTLDIYVLYNQNYCIDDGVVSDECVTLLDDNDQYLELLAKNNKDSLMLQRYFSRLEVELKSCTSIIQEGLLNE